MNYIIVATDTSYIQSVWFSLSAAREAALNLGFPVRIEQWRGTTMYKKGEKGPDGELWEK